MQYVSTTEWSLHLHFLLIYNNADVIFADEYGRRRETNELQKIKHASWAEKRVVLSDNHLQRDWRDSDSTVGV
jgi:hypothetical protein